MILLLDECISIHDEFFVVQGHKNIRSVDVLGAGAKDNKILEYAKDNHLTLVTNDAKFAIRAMKNGVKVVYKSIHDTNKEFILKPKSFDRIGEHLKQKADVIRP